MLKDFRSPLRLHPRFQNFYHRKGLVSEAGEKKLAFAVLRDHYRARAGTRTAIPPAN